MMGPVENYLKVVFAFQKWQIEQQAVFNAVREIEETMPHFNGAGG
jgi:hypothetical protein